MSRERTPAELGEDLDEIKAAVRELMAELKAAYVPRDLYEARHTALRSEVATELAHIQADMKTKASSETVRSAVSKAETAQRIAWGVLILLAGIIVTALVGFLQAGPA